MNALEKPHLIIIGDPVDGFSYHGPFVDHAAASEFAETNGHKFDFDWWIAQLHEPTT